jgi:hypothetical protein
MSNHTARSSRASPGKVRNQERLRTILILSAAFLAMIAGMAAKVGYDHFTGTVPFSWSAFFVPLMVAPIVYGSIYSFVKGPNDTVVMLIFSFQNGFFWQVIIGQFETSVTGGG